MMGTEDPRRSQENTNHNDSAYNHENLKGGEHLRSHPRPHPRKPAPRSNAQQGAARSEGPSARYYADKLPRIEDAQDLEPRTRAASSHFVQGAQDAAGAAAGASGATPSGAAATGEAADAARETAAAGARPYARRDADPARPQARYQGSRYAQDTRRNQAVGYAPAHPDVENLSRARQRAGASRPAHSISRRSVLKRAAIGVVGLAVLGGGGTLYWTHRAVAATINGKRMSMPVGSTAAELLSKSGVKVTPGNLISVSGKMLKQGQGKAFSLKVNDKALSDKDLKAYRLRGGEKLDFANGEDITEPYTTKIKETAPVLTMEGNYGVLAWVKHWGKTGKEEIRTGKMSGETAPGKTIQKLENLVIKLQNIQPKDNQKLVAITFDDGPSIYTQRYLDILKEKGIKASFFNIGGNVNTFPQLTKACLDAGHNVFCHTYTHPPLSTVSPERVRQELSKTYAALNKAAGIKTTTLRPPYGDFKETTWLNTEGLLSASVIWNIDSRDWSRPGADAIYKNVTSNVQPGNIILMHDGGGPREQDIQALPGIIDEIKRQGFTFVTLSELFKSDVSGLPDYVIKGYDPMPKDAVWPKVIKNF